MKKILIASVCAFSLCLTSCASKKAPVEENPKEAAQIQDNENQAEEAEGQNETASEESDSEAETEADAEADTFEVDEEAVASEEFPEPEEIEEPEIITLEPQDQPETSDNKIELSAEEVEKEEPPVIADIEKDQSSENENQEGSEAADIANAAEENTSADDIEVTGISDSDDDSITVIGGGIDITDDDSASEEKYNEKAEDITPSRSVTLKKFEYLDITYPGSGWIYMGLIDNSKDLAYFGRKLGTKDTKFTLQARAAGTKIVHFYRNDPLTGKYLDDYIEVVILSENGSNKTHIEAPEYKLPVQKKEKPVTKTQETETSENTEEEKTESKTVQTAAASKKTETTKSATSSAVAATTTSSAAAESSETKAAESESSGTTASASASSSASTSTESSDSASLLKEAQLLYNEKEYAAALKKLNQFFEYSTDNRDEALYLKGQILEAKSDVRDIKASIDAYTTLTKNYPASKLWDSANKRIIYLKRFYLEVR